MKRQRWARAKWEQSAPETLDLVLRYRGRELVHFSIPSCYASEGGALSNMVRSAKAWAMRHGFDGLKWPRPKTQGVTRRAT